MLFHIELFIDLVHASYNQVVLIPGVTEEVGLVDKLVVMFDSCSQLMLTIISCIGIPGNIMVLIVILTTPEMRHKVFNMFIVHQSVIDLLACVGTLLLQYFNNINSVTDGKGTKEKWYHNNNMGNINRLPFDNIKYITI